jgi:hypothetical protein
MPWRFLSSANETLKFIMPVPLEISPEIRQSVAVFSAEGSAHPLTGVESGRTAACHTPVWSALLSVTCCGKPK